MKIHLPTAKAFVTDMSIILMLKEELEKEFRKEKEILKKHINRAMAIFFNYAELIIMYFDPAEKNEMRDCNPYMRRTYQLKC